MRIITAFAILFLLQIVVSQHQGSNRMHEQNERDHGGPGPKGDRPPPPEREHGPLDDNWGPPPPPHLRDGPLPLRDGPGRGPNNSKLGNWIHPRHRGPGPRWASTAVAVVGVVVFFLLVGGILYYKKKEQAMEKRLQQ